MTTSFITDLQLAPALCEQARLLGGQASLTEVIQTALEAYIKQLQAKIPGESQLEALLAILKETGQVDYYDDYDYKQLKFYQGFVNHNVLNGYVNGCGPFQTFRSVLEDYETATEFYNRCRAKSVQGSLIDFLLCAVSQRHQLPIFTTNKDFEYFQKHIAFE